MSTRREFIRQTLVSGATLAFATAGKRLCFAARTAVDSAAIKKFGAGLKGRLILPGDGSYETARHLNWWNAATSSQARPAMIAQCAGSEDVARAVEFARRHGLPAAVRSGGHSFLGWSTCEDGVVIDLSPMKAIAVNPRSRTVRAGAGVIARELVQAAARHDLAPVLGECASVGIAGLTLGGGLGWLSGKYGAACDNLLSAEVVTAAGRAIVSNAAHNADLFWGIRGGGGNFGIVTSLEYRLHPVRDVVAGGFTYRVEDAPVVLRFFRDFMAAAPDSLQAGAYLDSESLDVVLCYDGEVKDGERAITPLRTVVKPVRDTVQRRLYSETFTMPPFGEGVPKKFSTVRGVYLERMADETIDIAVGRLPQAPTGCGIGFLHYMHGAVCRVTADATAFELRKPDGLHVAVAASWDDPGVEAPATAWADQTWKLLQPYSGGRVYANYQSREGESASRAVFGENYSRLASIKHKYDPTNFLRRNPNIRPALP